MFIMKIFLELLGEEGMYKPERLFGAFSRCMYVCLSVRLNLFGAFSQCPNMGSKD